MTVIHIADTFHDLDVPFPVMKTPKSSHPGGLNIYNIASFSVDDFPSPFPHCLSRCVNEQGHLPQLDPSVLTMENEERADYFWAHHLAKASPEIVLGIHTSFEALKSKGYETCVFPNGEKVPLEQVSIGVVEVIPNTNFHTVHRLFEIKDEIRTHGNSSIIHVGERILQQKHWGGKTPVPCTAVTVDGMVKTHVFLQAKLPSVQTYVMDPTARGLDYKPKEKGQFIVHSTWEEWKSNFPGEVVSKYSILCSGDLEQDEGETRPPLLLVQDLTKNLEERTLYAALYCIGNGPINKNLERLAANLIKYLERDICTYCGRVDGLHPEKLNVRYPYFFCSHELKFCGKCGQVKYCGTFCQKLEWPFHKPKCLKKVP